MKYQLHAFSVVALILVSVLSVPTFVSAHTTGASFETTVGGNFIDIGYSSSPPSIGELVSFDFNLRKGSKAGDAVPFDDVWVRITKGSETLFAGGINNGPLGGPRMSYVFLEPGKYDISARFEKEAGEIATASFTLDVGTAVGSPAQPSGSAVPGGVPIAGLFIAFGLGVLLVLGFDRLGLR